MDYGCLKQTLNLTLCRKTYAALILILSLFILAVTAFAGEKDNTLIYGLIGNTRTLNNAVLSGTSVCMPGTQIFASPLRFDGNWNPKPYLATSWEFSKDQLSLTLHLVKDATFHDGKPITSADVAFSIGVIKQYHPFKSMFQSVKTVDTPDAHTAVIRLSKPHPAILICLSPPLCPILPKHIYGDGRDLRTHPANQAPVGSGPFRFVKSKADDYVLLERYDGYFMKGLPLLDKIIFKYYDINGDAVSDLKYQHIHYYPLMVNNVNTRMLKKEKHLSIMGEGYDVLGPLVWIAFNNKKKPFDDVRVRRALAYAIDRDNIVKYFSEGFVTVKPATGPISPENPFFSPDVERYDYDIEKANAMLDEAGLKRDERGIRFSAYIDFLPITFNFSETAEYLKHSLARSIGVELIPRYHMSMNAWMEQVAGLDYDLNIDIVFNWGDPLIGVHRTFMSDNIKKGVMWSNTEQYVNPEVDGILKSAETETNPEKRKELYARFQKMVMEDAPVYPLIVFPYITIQNNTFIGFENNIWGAMSPLDHVTRKP